MRNHRKLTNLQKTLFSLFILSLISAFTSYLIQNKANHSVTSCSYLDPITVDIAALIVALFFILEGMVDIIKHRESKLMNQINRCLRVCLGVGILTIHIMQFIHK